jgi:hypothetical protein
MPTMSRTEIPTTRIPPPEREVPPGYRLIAVEESDDWRTEDGVLGCRRGSGWNRKGAAGTCGKPAVLALRRTPSRPGTWGKVVPQWWRYCEAHAYGRWVEGGKVLCWILVEDDAGITSEDRDA